MFNGLVGGLRAPIRPDPALVFGLLGVDHLDNHLSDLAIGQFNEPLTQGGWMELYLGYIKIPGVVGGASISQDFSKAAAQLGTYIEKVIRDSGKDFGSAKSVFAKKLNADKATRMIAAAAHLEEFTAEEVTAEIGNICTALEALDGVKRDPEAVVAAIA